MAYFDYSKYSTVLIIYLLCIGNQQLCLEQPFYFGFILLISASNFDIIVQFYFILLEIIFKTNSISMTVQIYNSYNKGLPAYILPHTLYNAYYY
jgi:hypothetical protein